MIWEPKSSRMCSLRETMSSKAKIISMREDLGVMISFMSKFNIELVKCGEVSSQIDFARAGQFNESRKDEKTVVPMYPEWKTKQVSPVRFQNTHQNIFVHQDVPYSPLRASKLKLEEKRERPFNIITGEQDNII